jgi:hypothetical protein
MVERQNAQQLVAGLNKDVAFADKLGDGFPEDGDTRTFKNLTTTRVKHIQRY